ncbi:MAG TPA: transposase, partial [Chitinophagales bacterium]|nr:transposase [Chitinophagales bacterium]
MSRKYKFRDNSKLYFVSFAFINWIDVFIRNEYKQVLLDSLEYCQKFKELELYAWCIMTSHVHLIIGSRGNPMHNIIRDMKSHTSTQLRATIGDHPLESRKEWMLWLMGRAGKKNSNNRDFQFWQQNNEPIELNTNLLLNNTLHYTHYNPVAVGFVNQPEDWIYSSARDYAGEKGLLKIIFA